MTSIPAPFLQMSFLRGDWRQVGADETVEEHWIGPIANTMTGITLTL